jgi:hypothetical protein
LKQASNSQIRKRCIAGLTANLLRLHPDIQLDSRGYIADFTGNLIHDVLPQSFEADLAAGAGEELRNKFLAPHSSSALAVNSFGWFYHKAKSTPFQHLPPLELVGFEQKFPTGLAAATAPHLDIVFKGSEDLVAIESKCLEYLTPKQPDFSSRYRTQIRDERCTAAWYGEMVRLMEASSSEYRHLDVAQLIKHALGLSYRQSQEVTLMYFWWEPENWQDFAVFVQHLAEIEKFASKVEGSVPRFQFQAYGEHWQRWSRGPDRQLADHAKRLQARYSVTI